MLLGTLRVAAEAASPSRAARDARRRGGPRRPTWARVLGLGRGRRREEQHRHTTTTTKERRLSTKPPLRRRRGGNMMGSVGDELLVARQADDGGAGELLRWDRAAGGRRGVGQVPRRHGLEEPLGRRRACGRAGRRRWRPAGSSRHAQSAARTRDARTSKEQKDTASEPGSAATTSTRRSDRSAARLLRGEACRHASL